MVGNERGVLVAASDGSMAISLAATEATLVSLLPARKKGARICRMSSLERRSHDSMSRCSGADLEMTAQRRLYSYRVLVGVCGRDGSGARFSQTP